MSLRARVQRLRGRQGGRCALCSGRPAPVFVWLDDPAEDAPQPQPCPACGALPRLVAFTYDAAAEAGSS